MLGLSIGLSALTVSQRVLDVIGQNIANADNPDYHRQVADLAVRSLGSPIGNGVEIKQVRRLLDSVLETSIRTNSSEAEDLSARLDTLRRIETLIGLDEGSIHDILGKFFNQLEQLSARPEDAALRGAALASANALTSQIRVLDTEFVRLGEGILGQARQAVDDINRLLPEIAELNDAIRRAVVGGVEANDLRDRRDGLIGTLSGLIDTRVIEQDFGQVNVLAAGVPVVLGAQVLPLAFNIDSENRAIITAAGSDTPLTLSGGRLRGLLATRNEILPDFRARFDDFVAALTRGLDEIHATGLGLTGPFTSLASQRRVSNTTVPLAQADLSFPPQAGDLFLTVTDQAAGTRTLHRIAINPATQSLADVAAAISAIPDLQGLVNAQTGTLTILSRPGTAFDFAGRLASTPQTVAFTGTSAPTLSGTYTGTANDVLTFTVVGSGSIGVTPGLQLEARNGAGQVLASLDIGQGYEPGTTLPAVEGVTVRLASGTVNNADSFSAQVVGQPDSAGLLTALGLNTFFRGDGANTLEVRPDLLANPEQLALSRTGEPGDRANLLRMLDFRDRQILAGNTLSPANYLAALHADIGSQVRDVNQRHEAKVLIAERFEAERQSISGVDPNEELVRMLQFQRAFQMGARYITVINETLDDLLRLVG